MLVLFDNFVICFRQVNFWQVLFVIRGVALSWLNLKVRFSRCQEIGLLLNRFILNDELMKKGYLIKTGNCFSTLIKEKQLVVLEGKWMTQWRNS